jgi:hypothetical protein
MNQLGPIIHCLRQKQQLPAVVSHSLPLISQQQRAGCTLPKLSAVSTAPVPLDGD